MAWSALPRRTQAIIGGGVLVAIVLVVAVIGSQAGNTPLPDPSAAARESPGEGPVVPPVDPCDMLTLEQLDVAMGLLELPMDQRNIITFSGDEACTWVNDRNGEEVEGLLIRIEPGAVEDFEPEGQLDGVTGEAVEDLGRAAVWFGGERQGTLSVVEESQHGYLFVRVTIARPDLEADDIVSVARDLADIVLPQFPGMGGSEDAATTTIESEPTSLPPTNWVENLLSRESAGDWTLGEGLVATLQAFAGEAGADEVFRKQDELVDDSGTAVVSLARAYLEDGPDEAAKAEISRLLELIFFTRDELEAVSEPAALQPGFELASVRRQPGPGSVLRAGGPCGSNPEPCLVEFRSFEMDNLDTRYGAGEYRIYHYSDAADGGWDVIDFLNAANAMHRTALTYEPLAADYGGMPPVTFLFTREGMTELVSYADRADCSININPPMQQEAEPGFKQLIAQHMAYCLFAAVLPDHQIETSGSGLWWTDALAWHLSNSAYPPTNLEWTYATTLAGAELETDLFHRTTANAMFFQHLWSQVGRDDAAIIQLMRRLQPGGAGDAETLASTPDMDFFFHEFAKRATDASVPDSSGSTVTYEPEATRVSVNVAPHSYVFNLSPFWTQRVRVEIPAGQKACIEYQPVGTSLLSWRPGTEGPGGAGGWEAAFPNTIEGTFVVVATATQEDESPILSVTDLVPASEPSCDPPATPEASCLSIICSPSEYFRSITNVPSWFIDVIE